MRIVVRMQFFETSIDIAAARSAVWDLLVDIARYPEWGSGVLATTGAVAPGARISITSAVDPARAFKLRVVEFDPHRRMQWKGGAPLGLFTGRRTFTLTERPDGGTGFHLREEFTGPMLPLVWRSMPDLQRSFEQFAAGLRAETEAADGRA